VPLNSGVFSLALCMVGGIVVGVSTRTFCGGESEALELGRLLATWGLRLQLDSWLCSRLCNNGCLLICCIIFEHSLCLCCIIVVGTLPLVMRR
jgi:hypothetical protein